MPEPLVKRGKNTKPRSRNKNGTWRKKRDDSGKSRLDQLNEGIQKVNLKCPCGLWFETKTDLERHYKENHVEVTYNLKTGVFYVIRRRTAIKKVIK